MGIRFNAPKLAYVVHSLNPGGTERLVVAMSLALAEEFGVEIVCLDEPGSWATDLRRAGIPVYCLWRQPGLDLSIAGKLARRLRCMGAEIVHAHQYTPWFYAALSSFRYSVPRLLFEEHGRFYPEADSVKRRWVNRAVARRSTDKIVAVSADVRMRLQRFEGLDARQIEVVYNGVEPAPVLTKEVRAARRKQLGFGDGDFVVGTVGRFDPIKNLPMLVESLARARREEAHVRGLLVGDGPELGSIRSLIAAAAMTDAVCSTGFREDARELVQCMDLFVLPSLSEGTSMALLEAMAASVPVAVTDVGGNTEVVEAGVSGWIVPSGSVDSLTAAICEAVRDPEKRSRFATAGRSRFLERFTFDEMIDRYRQIYGELLSRSAPDAVRQGRGTL